MTAAEHASVQNTCWKGCSNKKLHSVWLKHDQMMELQERWHDSLRGSSRSVVATPSHAQHRCISPCVCCPVLLCQARFAFLHIHLYFSLHIHIYNRCVEYKQFQLCFLSLTLTVPCCGRTNKSLLVCPADCLIVNWHSRHSCHLPVISSSFSQTCCTTV